ncbi:lysophospholipid acyltransferase 1 isoform X2 [Erpetoichthys calabaricus]|uniref:lysophospholipid acyltransferase 1 isoform X2 n=1 Tax=Erpetoichthys calabaricus TaxID=27687 RepID=UPI00223443BF|nr:lysophospholipid acyltransferase 1 isoform X2 [Erpetoichthys calabaricus]
MENKAPVVFRTTGSTLLYPVSEFLRMPLDQVNFVVCQLFALMSAFWFRCYLSPNKDRKNIRHVVATTLGTLFGIFCFGWPLMIITQKITALAFQVHDGIGRKAEELTPDQRRLSIKEKPSLIEYLSYHLNFLSILAGPFSNYKDYISFIEGNDISMKLLEIQTKQKQYERLTIPSPTGPVIRKLVICGVSVFLFLTLAKSFPVAHMLNEQSMSKTSFLSRVCYFYIAIQAGKPKYYFAWTIADAVHNAAGYGFSGIDDKGNFRWDLVSNLNIWNIETATSFKMYIDNWNIQTAGWLKRICYDRAPYYPTALTFVLSAVWHGVYPGYYFTFITAIPITMAARAVRNNIRHHFLVSQMMKTMYDIMTWVFTQFAVSYTVMPFILLAMEPTIMYYKYMYFHFHIISILVLILLPIKKNPHSIQYHSFHIHVKEKYRTRRIQ